MRARYDPGTAQNARTERHHLSAARRALSARTRALRGGKGHSASAADSGEEALGVTNEPGPALDQINLVVREMDAMVDFYRRLGLKIDDPGALWNQHHRTAASPDGLDVDLDSREFAMIWNQGWPEGQTGAVIGFRLRGREVVDQTYEDLISAGYVGQQREYDAFWGARYAVVEDPDGNSVGLMSPVDPARRTRPPTPPA
jgi:catechol 2,3-dioxygenase-like lactoylglutathione lyase family enzyme